LDLIKSGGVLLVILMLMVMLIDDYRLIVFFFLIALIAISGCGLTPREEEDFTIIHPIFGYTYEKYNTPLVAIVFYSFTTSIFMFFKFEVLVEVRDTY